MFKKIVKYSFGTLVVIGVPLLIITNFLTFLAIAGFIFGVYVMVMIWSAFTA